MNTMRKREIASTVFRKISEGKYVVQKSRHGDLFLAPATYTERFVRGYAAVVDDVIIETEESSDAN